MTPVTVSCVMAEGVTGTISVPPAVCDYSGYPQLAEAGTECQCGQGAGLKGSKSGWQENEQKGGQFKQFPNNNNNNNNIQLYNNYTGNPADS